MTLRPPKYTTDELAAMARHVLAAQHDDPHRWLDLLARLWFRTGVPPQEAMVLIERMAQG